MKLYLLETWNHGEYGEKGLKRVGAGLSKESFTARTQSLKVFVASTKKLRERATKFRIRLRLIETPTVTAEIWQRFFDTGDMPFRVLEELRDERYDPVAEGAV